MRVRSGQERAEFPGRIFLPTLTLHVAGDVVFLRGHQDNVLDARVPRGARSGGKGNFMDFFLYRSMSSSKLCILQILTGLSTRKL